VLRNPPHAIVPPSSEGTMGYALRANPSYLLLPFAASGTHTTHVMKYYIATRYRMESAEEDGVEVVEGGSVAGEDAVAVHADARKALRDVALGDDFFVVRMLGRNQEQVTIN